MLPSILGDLLLALSYYYCVSLIYDLREFSCHSNRRANELTRICARSIWYMLPWMDAIAANELSKFGPWS